MMMYDNKSSSVHARTPISARDEQHQQQQQPRSHFKQQHQTPSYNTNNNNSSNMMGNPLSSRRQRQRQQHQFDNASIQASQNSSPSSHHHLNINPDNGNNNNNNIGTVDEYGHLITKPPKKNICTIPIASFFLLLVAVALIVTWQVFPTESIVIKYLPKFDPPSSPYTGPEAGSAGDTSDKNGGGGNGIDIDIPFENEVPVTDASSSIPSFMKCQEEEEEEALCCNGSPSNCQLKLNEMMFATLHNAMSTEETDFTFGYNHYKSLEKALVAGYRGINLDLCNCGSGGDDSKKGGLQFCHNVCDYGERMPQEVFTNIVNFLKEYPSEVIVLIFQASDQGPIVWNDLYDEMKLVEDFVDMMYVHEVEVDGGEGTEKEWPLMGDLVKSNKRIISFYFNGGTCTDDICPEPFHQFYKYTAETEYQSANLDDLRNIQYSCQLTRGPGGFKGDFFAVNNFVTPPDPEASKITNGQQFLSERLTKCANYNGKRPNFVYVDFWGEGVTSQLVQYANKQLADQKEDKKEEV